MEIIKTDYIHNKFLAQETLINHEWCKTMWGSWHCYHALNWFFHQIHFILFIDSKYAIHEYL